MTLNHKLNPQEPCHNWAPLVFLSGGPISLRKNDRSRRRTLLFPICLDKVHILQLNLHILLHLVECSPEKQVITTFKIGRVIRSKSSNFSKGDLVISPLFLFSEYCNVAPIYDGDWNFGLSQHTREALGYEITDLGTSISGKIPVTVHVIGVLRFPARVGIEVIGNPKSGSNIFISVASLATSVVGNFVEQLANLKVVELWVVPKLMKR